MSFMSCANSRIRSRVNLSAGPETVSAASGGPARAIQGDSHRTDVILALAYVRCITKASDLRQLRLEIAEACYGQVRHPRKHVIGIQLSESLGR